MFHTCLKIKILGIQVRYSLSGSEAVDAALKDIRATTSKPLIVRFTSAYHGHISGINFLDCENHVFLPECSQESLDFIEKYHYRIAAVIVNPMQHFTGLNKPSPPGEKVTISSRIRESVPREEYARWLFGLQEKCTYCTKYLTKVSPLVRYSWKVCADQESNSTLFLYVLLSNHVSP